MAAVDMRQFSPWRDHGFNSRVDLDNRFTLCEFMAMTHSTFIEELGDTGKVAAALGQNDTTVSMWKQRGVPWRWRPALAEMARNAPEPVAVPEGFLNPSAQAA